MQETPIPGWGRSTGEGISYPLQYSWAPLVTQLGKNPPAMWETWVQSLGWENPLEKGKTAHSCILAWRIPWTVKSMGSQRVRHDWATCAFMLYTLTKLCYTKALEWSSLVPGPKAKSSSEIMNPTSFTVSYHLCAKLLQWCPTLCGSMDCSLPGPSVHGIFQARILEWIAGLSSRGSSQWRDWTCIS